MFALRYFDIPGFWRWFRAIYANFMSWPDGLLPSKPPSGKKKNRGPTILQTKNSAVNLRLNRGLTLLQTKN